MAIALPAVPIILEAIKDAAIVLGIVGGGAVVADQVSKANDRAKERARAAAAAETCVTCRKGPCAALAAGVPGVRYQGVAHGIMKGPRGDGLDSHHMPARSISPLPEDMGPAIKMEPADHAQTASFRNTPAAVAYRAAQQRLIRQGNFRAAFAMDVVDIRAKFGPKYDGAIAQAAAYMECLKRNGAIQ